MVKDQIIGHARQRTELAADLENGNVAHAYLFAGSPHLGKTMTAEWFAKEIITEGLSGTEKEEALREIDRLIHPDFLMLDQLWIEDVCDDFDVIAQSTNVPQQHRAKAPAMKTDIISIDDVREIQSRLQETGRGKHQVCIIRGVERMQEAAANAFLKILEEPPEGRIFVLTTDALSSLLPTMLSRARVMRFERVSNKDIADILKDVEENERRFILHLASGAPGTALRLARDPDALREEHLLHDQARSFWSVSSPIERLTLLTPLHERGAEAERFLLHLSLALREMPEYGYEQERALMEMVEGLKTNAHRQLIAQNFAIQVGR
jgi:DNA polymerase-3 subunit delta'